MEDPADSSAYSVTLQRSRVPYTGQATQRLKSVKLQGWEAPGALSKFITKIY